MASVCVLRLACGNKESQTESLVIDAQPTIEKLQADTTVSSVQIESPKEEQKPSACESSSSYSSCTNKSTKYGNMRGFDPALEDDMNDNGMIRYMENNDEEEWD